MSAKCQTGASGNPYRAWFHDYQPRRLSDDILMREAAPSRSTNATLQILSRIRGSHASCGCGLWACSRTLLRTGLRLFEFTLRRRFSAGVGRGRLDRTLSQNDIGIEGGLLRILRMRYGC